MTSEEFKKTVLKVNTLNFVPFKDNNILEKCPSGLLISDTSLRIHATSAFFPLFANIIQNSFSANSFIEMFTLNKVSTQEGFAALGEGRIDLLCSTIPNEQQIQFLKSCGHHYNFIPICKEPLVFLLNQTNNIDNLTQEQIKDIYYGKIKNWKEVGGEDREIHTYQLEQGNGSQNAFEQIVQDNKIDEYHHKIYSMPDIVDAVAKDPFGICYSYWSFYAKMYANSQTKMIKVNGQMPKTTTYPLNFDILLIYDKKNTNQSVHTLVNYLTSETGYKKIKCYNVCKRNIDNRRIAIMQPYFFPYIGYFQLINAVDLFVIYDDGNMIRNGFIHKNYILSKNQDAPIQSFTINICRKKAKQSIKNMSLADNSHNFQKILRMLEYTYHDAPYYHDVISVVKECLAFQEDNLVKFLVHQLKTICDYIGITTSFALSSEVPKDGLQHVEEKCFRICDYYGIHNYINPIGGMKLYLKEKWSQNGVNLSFLKRKNSITYKQNNHSFVQDLSIIDIMMYNNKDEIKKILLQYDLL